MKPSYRKLFLFLLLNYLLQRSKSRKIYVTVGLDQESLRLAHQRPL